VNFTRNTTGGLPSSAMAVDSLRLFPPLYVAEVLSAYSVRPSFSSAHSITYNVGYNVYITATRPVEVAAVAAIIGIR